MKDPRHPTAELIASFVESYNSEYQADLDSYKAGVRLAQMLPRNDNIQDILIKVNCINGIFKTGIGDTLAIAQQIEKLNLDERLDERLNEGDFSIIDSVGLYISKKAKQYNFFSFATKYCHCHLPNKISIFDSKTVKTLTFYKDHFDNSLSFDPAQLRTYSSYAKVIEDFRHFANAHHLTISVIDRFLWAQSR